MLKRTFSLHVKIQQFRQVSSNFPLTISIHDIQANTCKKIRSFLIFSWVRSRIVYKTINYKNIYFKLLQNLSITFSFKNFGSKLEVRNSNLSFQSKDKDRLHQCPSHLPYKNVWNLITDEQ